VGVLVYLGFLGIAVVMAVGIRWFDPYVVEQLARRTGLRSRHGWALLLAASAWTFLPFLAGATTDGGELWLVGSASVGAGFYLLSFAAAPVDEYRILRRADRVVPNRVSVGSGERLVATSGDPVPEGEGVARTPFSGTPAVHVDWIVQRRERVGARKRWRNVATDVESVPFVLGDRVHVSAGRHRVFSSAERTVRFDPDEALPDTVEEALRERPVLPNPTERTNPLRVVESYVPADGPVTVVGNPSRGERPGEVVFDSAPVDPVLGSHADRSVAGDTPEAILVRGDAREAESYLRKRVYWLGAGGIALVLGGQLLAFTLSPASLGGLPFV
jgi:hypothetical protein